jgi:ribosomal protein L15
MFCGLLVLDRRSVSEAVANVLAGSGRGCGVGGPAGHRGQDDRKSHTNPKHGISMRLASAIM